MTWETALGIIELAGFVITAVTLGWKFSAMVTRLEVSLKNTVDTMREDRTAARKEHAEIWETVDEHTETLQNHEIRLHDLERR